VKIWRFTADGEYANSFPCSLCRKALIHYKLRVHCSTGPGEWFSGHLNEDNVCKSKLTTSQKRFFAGDRKSPINIYTK
jgi:hypothetical protein